MNERQDQQPPAASPNEAENELKSPMRLLLLAFALPLIIVVLCEVFDIPSLIIP